MSTTRDTLSDLEIYFDAIPGADRTLLPWARMREWFRQVEHISPRLAVHDIGDATLGAPMDLLVISSEDTVRNLPDALASRANLSDCNLLADPANADGRLAGNKPIVLITAGIHADEVGGVQLMPELVRDLVLSDDADVAAMLENTIILIVPTLNPDGMNLVGEWYRRTLGTSSEGTTPPELYHPYAGHDNNRDWYTHLLEETRNTIDGVHRPWRPHIVLDLHQMGHLSPRYVVPPYIDPREPHVHPRISALTGEIGSVISTAQERAGHAGAASGVMFDCYSPTRAYPHYHGGVRILAEAASAKIASPISIEGDKIEVRRGFDPNVPSTHMPVAWQGGEWRLRDIMDYHMTTIWAVLNHATIHADQWVRDQWAMLADEVTQSNPPSFTIAPLKQQIDPAATIDLIEILRRGEVHVEFVESGNDNIQRGSFLIRANQPLGSYARALLDLTPYPTPRTDKDETSSTIPYDVTSHCLPIHMGVEVSRTDVQEELATRPVSTKDLSAFDPPSAGDVRRGLWLAIDGRGHASIRIVVNALRNGAKIRRLRRPHFGAGRVLAPGTWLIIDDHVFAAMSDAHRNNVRTWLVDPIANGTVHQTLPRIGLHIPWNDDAIDAGWVRLFLERAGIPYEIVRNEDIRAGELAGFDTVLIAHLPPKQLKKGNEKVTYPPEYPKGLGNTGIKNVGRFMEAGGVVVTLDGATDALIPNLNLPVRRPLHDMKQSDFSCPGSILKIIPEPSHPVTLGIDEPLPIMFVNSTGFMVEWEGTGNVAARYASEDLLVSGWIHGEDHLHGLAAVIDFPIGKGRFTGFGFRPHFRCQMPISEPMLTNALMRSGTRDDQT